MSSNMRQKKFVLHKQAIKLTLPHSFEWSLQELRHHIMVAVGLTLAFNGHTNYWVAIKKSFLPVCVCDICNGPMAQSKTSFSFAFLWCFEIPDT